MFVPIWFFILIPVQIIFLFVIPMNKWGRIGSYLSLILAILTIGATFFVLYFY